MNHTSLTLNVPISVLESSENEYLKDVGKRVRRDSGSAYLGEVEVTLENIPDDAMTDLLPKIEEHGDVRSLRVLKAILSFRGGDFEKKIPSYPAFKTGLQEFLRANNDRGWLFFLSGSNMMAGYIDRISTYTPRRPDDGKPRTTLTLSFFAPSGRHEGFRMDSRSYSWEPAEVTHKTIPEILSAAGLFTEAPDLLAGYDAEVARYDSDIAPRFAQQIVITSEGSEDDDDFAPGGSRRAIHDLRIADMQARPVWDHSSVLKKEVPVPIHPLIKCFDLHSHTFGWSHVNQIQPYVYDPSLREKLVLPQSHRDLLDVLTEDLEVFSGDIIRGKSAGNIIVCKGLPGLGKTLTAEVYSELTETPIYSVHAGSLGTSATSVESALKTIFKRQKRWGCIVLLDEADVFVKTRGDDLIQNSIVAEFLRTLEYFSGLMFMTTNRPDDIDEAIISRAAAIISYEPPTREARLKIWGVMFKQNNITPPKGLLGKLAVLFPTIAPRDIKMLLRLALRVSVSRDEPLTTDLFRRVAMFRAVKVAEDDDNLEDLI